MSSWRSCARAPSSGSAWKRSAATRRSRRFSRTRRKRHVPPWGWVLGEQLASGISHTRPEISDGSEAMKGSHLSPGQGHWGPIRTAHLSLEPHLPDSWPCCPQSSGHSMALSVALRDQSGWGQAQTLQNLIPTCRSQKCLHVSVSHPLSFCRWSSGRGTRMRSIQSETLHRAQMPCTWWCPFWG